MADIETSAVSPTGVWSFVGGAATNIFNSVESGITASTTQTQGQQPLTKHVNEISTCANANDTVTLPAAAIGKYCVVINNGANALRIFPASSDNCGAGVDTQIALASADMAIFWAYDATNWKAISGTMLTA